MKKHKIYSFLLCAAMLIPCALALTACGKPEPKNFNIKVEAVGLTEENEHYLAGSYKSKEEIVFKGETKDFKVQFLPGFKDEQFKVYVDNEPIEFQREVQSSWGGDFGELDCIRDLIFDIPNIQKDIEVKLDYSNCEIIQTTHNFDGTLMGYTRYASIDHSKLLDKNVFDINPDELEIKYIPLDGQLKVNYNSSLYLFVKVNIGDFNPSFDLMSKNSQDYSYKENISSLRTKRNFTESYLVTIDGETYQVFYYPYTTTNRDVSRVENKIEYDTPIFTPISEHNLFTLHFENNDLFDMNLLTDINEIKSKYYATIEESSKISVGDKTYYNVGKFGGANNHGEYPIYIGDKEYAEDDEVITNSKKQYLGKNLYLMLTFNKQFNLLPEDLQFSLYKDAETMQSIKTYKISDLTKISENNYLLEIPNSFINENNLIKNEIINSNVGTTMEIKTGFIILNTEFTNKFLSTSKDFSKIKIVNKDFLKNTANPKYIDFELKDNITELGYEVKFKHRQRQDGNYVYYVNKEDLNKFYFDLGVYLEDIQKTDAKLLDSALIYVNNNLVKNCKFEDANNNILKDVNLDLSTYSNLDLIDIKIEFKERANDKNATINLDKIKDKLDSGVKLYFTKDASKDFSKWELLTQDSILTLNKNETLYFIIDDDVLGDNNIYNVLLDRDPNFNMDGHLSPFSVNRELEDFYGNVSTIKDSKDIERNINYLTIDQGIYFDNMILYLFFD